VRGRIIGSGLPNAIGADLPDDQARLLRHHVGVDTVTLLRRFLPSETAIKNADHAVVEAFSKKPVEAIRIGGISPSPAVVEEPRASILIDAAPFSRTAKLGKP
jgi:hypothetical protein